MKPETHLLIFVLTLRISHAIDLCFLFGTCGNNNKDNFGGLNFNPRSDPGLEAAEVEGGWIEPKNSESNVLYYFGNDLGPSDWYSADAYCSERGGYLAEPLSQEENQFLKAQARRYGNTNWWIGLRLMENCQCHGVNSANGRSLQPTNSKFEATIDYESLLDPESAQSPVRTICPPGFEKICVGPSWTFSYSSLKPGFTDWNGRSGEPNGRGQEPCVALWSEYDWNWSDWSCATNRGGPRPFKAICQKDKAIISTGKRDVSAQSKFKDNYDLEQSDEFQDVDSNALLRNMQLDDDTPVRCIDIDIVYKSDRVDILSSIVLVDSAELCRNYCAEEPDCRFWSWFGFGMKRKCILKSRIKSENYRRPKLGAISGTMLNNCRPTSIPTPQTTQRNYLSRVSKINV